MKLQPARDRKRLHDGGHVPANVAHIDVMRANLLPAGIQARERQQLLQQIQQMPRRRANALHGLLRRLRQRLRNAHLE